LLLLQFAAITLTRVRAEKTFLIIPEELLMSRFASSFAALAIFVCSAQALMATVVFSDGGTHTVNSPSVDIALSNNTTLNVATGAVINAPSTSAAIGLSAVSTDFSLNNHIHVTGGSLTGGASTQAFSGRGGFGINAVFGTLDISGGTFTGGVGDFVPGDAVKVVGAQSTISNGTFHGAQGSPFGSAGNALSVYDGTMTISGGAFFGGDTASGAGAAGAALRMGVGNTDTPVHVTITHGTFTAGADSTPATYGPYAVVLDVADDSVLDLKGGTFVGGFLVTQTLNVYGTNLQLTSLPMGKHLSGTLMDGSPISVDMLVIEPYTINLITVPEPSSLVLVAIALAAAVAAYGGPNHRRSRTA
jgi:hypothetical protein